MRFTMAKVSVDVPDIEVKDEMLIKKLCLL